MGLPITIVVTTTLLFALVTVYGLKIELYHTSHPTHVALTQATTMKGKLGQFSSELVVHFSVGTPPFKTFAVFDTGSHLFWLQTSTCNPCLNQPQETHHDLAKSSSLQLMNCSNEACAKSKPQGTCKTSSICDYFMKYGDNTESLGYLATDIFTFSDGPPVNLVVGVGTKNLGAQFRRGHDTLFDCPGVFGLGKESWYQVENKFETERFSYCIPSDTTKTGYVHFGADVEWTGPVANMGDHSYFIYLVFDKIEFNGKPVWNPKVPWEGDQSWEGYEIMMDTGTPMSTLDKVMFEALVGEFEKLLGRSFIVRLYTCWDISPERLESITITLYFGDIPFKLSWPQLWRPDYPFSCLYFKAASKGEKPTLGSQQTTNKNIAISYPTNEIAIVERNC